MTIHKETLVFVGGGRITSALCAGLRLGGFHGDLVVYDRNPAKLRALQKESRVGCAYDLNSAVRRAGILIVAVRPASVAGILKEIAATEVAARVGVSLAAGIPLSLLSQQLRRVRWVRAMPSPVCRIGRGLTALSFDRSVSRAERTRVRNVFAMVGQVLEVPQRGFDAFTAAYSSTHGYHALATLAAAAQDAGLARKTALSAAGHALADGIEYWRESGLSVDELLQEAVTPGGIAAATMLAADKAGYARAVRKGIEAGIRQAQRNARSADASSHRRVNTR